MSQYIEQSNKIEYDWVYSEPVQKLLPFKLKHEWRLLISWTPKLTYCDVPAYIQYYYRSMNQTIDRMLQK